jgi:hypothetical protein
MPDKRSVAYWHNKAEESRVIAESMRNETTRKIMLGIATDFDRMARLALGNGSSSEPIIDQQAAALRKRSEIVDILMNT